VAEEGEQFILVLLMNSDTCILNFCHQEIMIERQS
jgi:hypothetical protein